MKRNDTNPYQCWFSEVVMKICPAKESGYEDLSKCDACFKKQFEHNEEIQEINLKDPFDTLEECIIHMMS